MLYDTRVRDDKIRVRVQLTWMVAGTLPPSSANSITNLKLNGIDKGKLTNNTINNQNNQNNQTNNPKLLGR